MPGSTVETTFIDIEREILVSIDRVSLLELPATILQVGGLMENEGLLTQVKYLYY